MSNHLQELAVCHIITRQIWNMGSKYEHSQFHVKRTRLAKWQNKPISNLRGQLKCSIIEHFLPIIWRSSVLFHFIFCKYSWLWIALFCTCVASANRWPTWSPVLEMWTLHCVTLSDVFVDRCAGTLWCLSTAPFLFLYVPYRSQRHFVPNYSF